MEYVKRLCCFLLIAETLLKLCPSPKYEGYMKMLTGLICLVMICVPLTSLFHPDAGGQVPELADFEQQVRETMEEARERMRDEFGEQLGKQLGEQLGEQFGEGWKADETFVTDGFR